LKPEESFTPTVESEFGADNVIVVKDAQGGQPILRWYKNWKPYEGDEPKATGDLYDNLMVKVNSAIMDEKIKTITFVWMQGERDARQEYGEVYEASLIGLYNQLCEELERWDINFVIGRLSDFDMNNERYPHWAMVRKIQVEVAENNPRFAWVDTDDLNDGINRRGQEIENDLHMSGEGYIILGKRFAERSIELINKNIETRYVESGFVRIFNGKDLQGWDGVPGLWSVKDGVIRGQTTEENPIQKNTFIIYRGGENKGLLKDFALKVKFRIENGNSGIQYRSFVLDPDIDKYRLAGYQAEVANR